MIASIVFPLKINYNITL